MSNATVVYDVAICGGGLAGLTLALQLRKRLPHLNVALLDRLTRPLPAGAFKVGEAVTEAGAHYLNGVVGKDYFGEKHLFKLGFRFFLGGSTRPIEERPEFGLRQFPVVQSYNLDRGTLENDLRDMAEKAGVSLLEGAHVADVDLSGSGPHEVCYRDANGREQRLRTRWLVDASGRRRLIQRKLGLTQDLKDKCSASWWRVPGRLDISDFVPAEKTDWHERVPGNIRYYSTNHLAGYGYWVWIIPLSCDMTSVGIVASDAVHDFNSFNTYERSLEWVRRFEPDLAQRLEGVKPLDFRCMRDYSYTSSRIFSAERWACVGEAATFSDPLYAAGTDLISLANCMVTDLVERDEKGELDEDVADYYNASLLGINDAMTHNIRVAYRVFHKPVVLASKVIWDTAAGWSFLAPLLYDTRLISPELNRPMRNLRASYFFLTRKVQDLLLQWGRLSPGRLTFDYLNFLGVSLLQQLRDRHLVTAKTIEERLEDARYSMDRIEELAQVVFRLAVEDVFPERLAALPGWINAWAVSLSPERWQQDRLFEPRTQPRDYSRLFEEVRALFKLSDQTQTGKETAVP